MIVVAVKDIHILAVGELQFHGVVALAIGILAQGLAGGVAQDEAKFVVAEEVLAIILLFHVEDIGFEFHVLHVFCGLAVGGRLQVGARVACLPERAVPAPRRYP